MTQGIKLKTIQVNYYLSNGGHMSIEENLHLGKSSSESAVGVNSKSSPDEVSNDFGGLNTENREVQCVEGEIALLAFMFVYEI